MNSPYYIFYIILPFQIQAYRMVSIDVLPVVWQSVASLCQTCASQCGVINCELFINCAVCAKSVVHGSSGALVDRIGVIPSHISGPCQFTIVCGRHKYCQSLILV